MEILNWFPKDMHWVFKKNGSEQFVRRIKRAHWTDAEEEILRKNYPNSVWLARYLPNKTRKSCHQKARAIGLVRRCRKWDEQEVNWLRKNYGNALRHEIEEHLPRRTIGAVYAKAFALKLDRDRKEPQPIGIYLIDEICARARELNFSLRDLDEEAGMVSYFRQKRAKAPPVLLRISAIEAAVAAMGGRIEIRWSDK